MGNRIAFIDLEVSAETGNVTDYGAALDSSRLLHTGSKAAFFDFISDADYLCGHNIIRHDLTYLTFPPDRKPFQAVDTLYLSPLLFPTRPYHNLVKDDKLQSDQLNNPANDAVKAMELFYDEVSAYERIPAAMKRIYFGLLHRNPSFEGFFRYVGAPFSLTPLESEIRKVFFGKFCEHADIGVMVRNTPVELAYALAILSSGDRYSMTPAWVYRNYPAVENVIKLLCGSPCRDGCSYCRERLDIRKKLKTYFGYDAFRTYDGEPLQERAAQAAVDGKSLIAVFPTGGGKSITFQLPALMAGENERGLTVVISPLQSLMKDQVDNLSEKGIVDAVTINGLLSPVERAEAFERVAGGMASILYISPESLRSRTMEKLLLSRNVVRFVIDEAHCFSAWGQDFRVDYLYIGDFIRDYVKKKNLTHGIPVSCFTATAKQKVISDIRDYFRQKLGLELELYATGAARTNLHYAVLHTESEEDKYAKLRRLLERRDCPAIVYVSRTRKAVLLAEKLTKDGFPAKPFHGKMDSSEKIRNQEAFISNEIRMIVATSAFGMGVDKKDVGLVVHYEISDSLENYVQEAGRAGRDQNIQADCYVLFNEDDLNKHFLLLNQTKLSIGEIQQVWKAVKDLTKTHPTVCRSALEIAREAGWDDAAIDVETRVRTAISALETAGYLERGQNVPKVYATSIMARNMEEAASVIESSGLFDDGQRTDAKRIIKSLISAKSISKAGNDDAESRVDYLADILGIDKERVIHAVNLMREEGILADSKDMTAYIRRTETENRSLQILSNFSALEAYLAEQLTGEVQEIRYKELNDGALKQGIRGATVRNIRTILFYWTIRGYIRKTSRGDDRATMIFPSLSKHQIEERISSRHAVASFIVRHLFKKTNGAVLGVRDEVIVQFSILELKNGYNERPSLLTEDSACTSRQVEDALLYLSKIGALNLEGGFLVLYNALSIKRLVTDNKIRYKNEDYRQLNEFYQNRIQQIHIVGEYANMMLKDYGEALAFVDDYFHMEYRSFIAKYFKGTRSGEINRNITPDKYNRLFGCLSETQADIIRDDSSRCIAVLAGPGSGKTRVLVHKLASLLLMEDVKSEQLLMLTFSRAAATEFKSRLIDLIGNAAYYVEIKTFHSYCFDLIGKIGNLTDAEDVVRKGADMIAGGEVEPGRITKTVLVIDEAQDMDETEYALVRALMERNEDMRVIAVGDDDQNIFEFRGSDSKYMKALAAEYGAKTYELLDNYRSDEAVVRFANAFAKYLPNRMKTHPIRSATSAEGIVGLVKHPAGNFEYAVVEQLRRQRHGETVCVLTSTNEEALRVTGLLTENGIRSRLVQTNDWFLLGNIAEIRYFIEAVSKNGQNPIISDPEWKDAEERLNRAFSKSAFLPVAQKMIKTFSSLNPKKYRTDFLEFVSESRLEDFFEGDGETVLVSTIHKSKGREFDTVYVLLGENVNFYDEQTKRAAYVGFTRAKHALYIHYRNGFLDRFSKTAASFRVDETVYPEPDRIMLQFSYRDVHLGYFKYVKHNLLALQSGSALDYADGTFLSGNRPVAKLSKKASELMETLWERGYAVASSKVRLVLFWKGEEDETESRIVLPDVHFEKRKD